MENVKKLLIDLARWSVLPVSENSEFGAALQKRMRAPVSGDVVIETTSFRYDPEVIGVFRERIPDAAHPPREGQPESDYLWVIESIDDGKTRNWGNCDFLAVPTKALRDEVQKSLEMQQE